MYTWQGSLIGCASGQTARRRRAFRIEGALYQQGTAVPTPRDSCHPIDILQLQIERCAPAQLRGDLAHAVGRKPRTRNTCGSR